MPNYRLDSSPENGLLLETEGNINLIEDGDGIRATVLSEAGGATVSPGLGQLILTGFAPTVMIVQRVSYPTVSGSFTEGPTDTWGSGLGLGVSNKVLPDSTNGRYFAEYKGTGNRDVILGWNTTSTLEAYTAFPLGVFVSDSVNFYGYVEDFVPTATAVVPAIGDLFGLNRVGDVFTAEYYRNGVWTVLYTFAATSTAKLYNKADIANTSKTLVNAQGQGLVDEVGGVIVLPGVGVLLLTGFAPTVVVSDNKIVSPGLGQLLLTGFAPTVSIGINVYPGVGVLLLTGFAPTVVVSDNKTVTPGVGVLLLTGFAPTVVVSDHKTVSPGAGALLLTGFAPTVVVGVNVTPGAGVLLLTGFAPTVVVSDNKIIEPGRGELILQGFPPDVVVSDNKIIQPGAGELILEGFPPTVVVGVNVSPGVGVLLLTGFAPEVVVSDHKIITPGIGELVLTGFAPTVVVSGGAGKQVGGIDLEDSLYLGRQSGGAGAAKAGIFDDDKNKLLREQLIREDEEILAIISQAFMVCQD